MSWDCCSPRGECRMGPGCPAGVLLDQPAKPASCPAGMCTGNPGCADVACPGHPGLRRVQLLNLGKPEAERGVLSAVLWGVVKGAVVAFAVVGVAFTVAVLIEVVAPVAKTVGVVV